jgi:AcrR family transcriptional regulator
MRRAATVEAVIALAATTNPADITTAQIAAYMGVTQGALFRHFSDKESVWLAVMGWTSDTLLARIDAVDGATPTDKLQAIFAAHVEFVVEHTGVPRILFGELQQNVVHHASETKAGGYLEYTNARVRWFLSIDIADVPEELRARGQRTFRSITLDGRQVEFSEGFVNLHTRSYEEILAGRGYGPEDNRTAITAVSHIRAAKPVGLVGDYHPALARAVK